MHYYIFKFHTQCFFSLNTTYAPIQLYILNRHSYLNCQCPNTLVDIVNMTYIIHRTQLFGFWPFGKKMKETDKFSCKYIAPNLLLLKYAKNWFIYRSIKSLHWNFIFMYHNNRMQLIMGKASYKGSIVPMVPAIVCNANFSRSNITQKLYLLCAHWYTCKSM
jgi:hypothetical protein